MEINISFKGVDLCVVGVHTKEEQAEVDYPGSKSEFEIESVFVIDSSVDVFNFFSANDLTEMQDLVLEKL